MFDFSSTLLYNKTNTDVEMRIRTMKRILTVLAVCMFVFTSCGKSGTEEAVAVWSENVQQEQQAPVTVSEYAKEYFLEPLEKYSWEKEHNTEYVVLHFTSDVVADKDNPYDMQQIRKIFEENEVSIHYIIDRDGEAYCYIPESRSAWHSGVGEFAGDEKYTNKMNKYSVGIEIVAIGSENDMAQYLEAHEYAEIDMSLVGFTDAQYNTLRKLVPDICERNNIPFDRQHIIGHTEYNPDKSDPGELFDWNRIFE